MDVIPEEVEEDVIRESYIEEVQPGEEGGSGDYCQEGEQEEEDYSDSDGEEEDETAYHDVLEPSEPEEDEKDDTDLEVLLDFYGPVKIPGIVMICICLMLYYEEGAAMQNVWFDGDKTLNAFRITVERLMCIVFGFWIVGFCLFAIQATKFVAMLLNKYLFPKLYKAPVQTRTKVIWAMMATKIGATVWRIQSEELVCNNKNKTYPDCVNGISYKISSYFITQLDCFSHGKYFCRQLILNWPMILLAITFYVTGKFVLPALMKGFRRREEENLRKMD